MTFLRKYVRLDFNLPQYHDKTIKVICQEYEACKTQNCSFVEYDLTYSTSVTLCTIHVHLDLSLWSIYFSILDSVTKETAY